MRYVTTFCLLLPLLASAQADPISEAIYIVRHPHMTPTWPPPSQFRAGFEIVESEYWVKASQSQFDTYGSMKAVRASGEGYISDGSNITYWGFGASGYDWNDVLIKGTLLEEQLKLECDSETNVQFCIWDKISGYPLLHYDQFNYYANPPKTWKAQTIYIDIPGPAISDYFYIGAAFGPAYPYQIEYEFAPSSHMIKVSQSQFDAYGGDPNNPIPVMRTIAIGYAGYVNDGSGIVYWGFEDGGDRDYKDVIVRETVTNGQLKLEFSGRSGYGWNIYDKITHTAVLHSSEFYNRYGEDFKWTILNVPEPTTLSLLAFGGLILGMRKSRTKERRHAREN